jgi:hypothetical protein
MKSVMVAGLNIVSKWLNAVVSSGRIIRILPPDEMNTGTADRNTGKTILRRPPPAVRSAGKDLKMVRVPEALVVPAPEDQDLMADLARMAMKAGLKSRGLLQQSKKGRIIAPFFI